MSDKQEALDPEQLTAQEAETAEQSGGVAEERGERAAETPEGAFEEISAEVGKEMPSADTLAAQLEEATRKAQQYWDQLLRTQAEMENLRRRTERELQNVRKFALENFARELLPVVDSLELGIQAAGAEGAELATLREGAELTLKQFQTVLEKFQIVAVDPLGEVFDPGKHQAMALLPRHDAAPDTVVKVFQKGYLLHDRLLRPAMVVVAQAAAETQERDAGD